MQRGKKKLTHTKVDKAVSSNLKTNICRILWINSWGVHSALGFVLNSCGTRTHYARSRPSRLFDFTSSNTENTCKKKSSYLHQQDKAVKPLPTCVLGWRVSVSAVLGVLVAVRVAVRILGLGAVRSPTAHRAHVKLVVGGVVRRLYIRLAWVVVMMALVCCVVTHVRGRGLGQSRRVLGARMAAHRTGEISRNTG